MAKKIELLHTTYDESGNIESQEVVHPLTSPDCIIMENGKTLDEVMGDGIATPTLTHEGTSFKVGVGDSNIEVVDGDVAGMTLKGQSYQNILPKPTTLIMETDEQEFKINDKIDSNIIIDDNIAEIATVKGKTIVNTVQEESGSEYIVLGEDLSGQSIVTTEKAEGNVKGVTLQGQTLVNYIQEPCEDSYVVLGAEDGIEIGAETGGCGTIEDTIGGSIKSAILKGNTLVNLNKVTVEDSSYQVFKDGWQTITTREQNYNMWETGDVSLFKTNTQYLVIIEVEQNNISYDFELLIGHSTCVFSLSETTGKTRYKSGEVGRKVLTLTTKNNFDGVTCVQRFATDNQLSVSNETVTYRMMFIEYQEDMENWDIPYFEGMKSVQMPVVKTTGKNLWNFESSVRAGVISFRDVDLELGTYYFSLDVDETFQTSPVVAFVTSTDEVVTYGYADRVNKYEITKDVSYITLYSNGFSYSNSYENITTFSNMFLTKEEHIKSEYEPYQSSTVTYHNLIEDGYSEYMAISGYDKVYNNVNTVIENQYYSYIVACKPNTTYYVKTSGTANRCGIGEFETTPITGLTYYVQKPVGENVGEFSFTTSSTTNYMVVYCYNHGSVATDTEFATIINGLEVELKEVETLRAIGDVKDELDLTTGKLTQRIGEVVLDGDEDWSIWSGTQNLENISTFQLKNVVLNSSSAIINSVADKFVTYRNASTLNTILGEGLALNNTQIFIRIAKTKLSTDDVDGFKTWLSNNNIAIQYELETPIIHKLDLQVTDQDGNTIPHIQTQPTVTHITASSDYLIPTITIDNNLVYDVVIKPSTLYTVRFKHDNVNTDNPLTVDLGGTTQTVTSTEFTITTPSTLTHNQLVFSGKNNVVSEVQVIEGDVTSIEYPFFEGMNDVKFSDSKFVGRGRNLVRHLSASSYYGFTIQKAQGSSTIINGSLTADYHDYYIVGTNENTHLIDYFNKMKVGETIHFSSNITDFAHHIAIGKPQQSNTYYCVDKYTKQSQDDVLLSMFIRFTKDCSFNNNELQIQIEIGSTATSYEPYRCVEVQQDVDSIPLTSGMFEQGIVLAGAGFVKGMSYQQFTVQTTGSLYTNRIKSKSIISVKPSSQYTINNMNDTLRVWGCEFDENGGYIKSITETINSFLIKTSANTHYISLVICYKSDTAITPSDLDSMNLILQEVPQEIVLRGIGDVKDELDLTRGEYIQRIGEVTITGYENHYWYYGQPSSGWNQDGDAKAFYSHDVSRELFKNKKFNGKCNCAKMRVMVGEIIVNNLVNYDAFSLGHADYVIIRKTGISTLEEFKAWLQQNPITVQYILATPIIHKVNLTNTKVIPSYATETHYETITPSDSLIPNITIPSTLNYNVAIKPSTEYTIRANTVDALAVDLGGATGTLVDGKATLTTPATLTHNEVKFCGTGSVKELMVVEGSEIKDNVPFFNGMKDVQMGGIKLVNIARGATVKGSVTANANKTQFTYTGNDSSWGYIEFDSSLLKPNTVYTLYMNVIKNEGTDSSGSIKYEIGSSNGRDSHNISAGYVGIYKKVITSVNESVMSKNIFKIAFRATASGNQVVIQNPMIIEGDWTHLDEIPYIESEMIIDQPIIRSQGKNLLDLSQFETATDEGKEVVYIGDYIPNIKFKENTQYIVKFTSKYREGYATKVKIKHTDGSELETVFSSTTFTENSIVSTQHKTVQYIQFWQNINNSELNCGVYVKNETWIEEGSTATSYEPYKHQTLYSNRVIGYEKNCYYTYDSGTRRVHGDMHSITADVEGLSIAYVTCGSSNFSFWDKDGVYISGKQFLDSTLSKFDANGFITVPSNAKYIKYPSSIVYENKPYYTKATVTGELPLRSLPNGVCDTLNLVTGEYVQRVGEVVLDGSENWNNKEDIMITKTNTIGFYIANNGKHAAGAIISDSLREITDGEMYSGDVEGISPYLGTIRIRISKNKLLTQNIVGFKQYLSQNPITVQYELATPIVRKLGFTTKGNYREQVLDGSETSWEMETISNNKTIRMATNPLQNPLYNTALFTDDYHVRAIDEKHELYEYITCLRNGGIYISIYQSKVKELSVQGCTRWLSQNPIKVGYISSAQSSESYSNVHKPIFFNNVNVQYLPNNVDIQPELTYQVRTRNSYVMDMMKANTKYSIKLLSSSGNMLIDGISYTLANNRTFISPSTLTNKELIISGQWYEPMIIEGDVTGKNLPYFKGILSSYHDVDEIEVYSVSKNLFDINNLVRINSSSHTTVTGNSITFNCTAPFLGCGDCWIPVEIGENYTISTGQIIGSNGVIGTRIEVRFYNSLPTPIESGTLPNLVGNALTMRSKITATALAKYMRVTISNGNDDVNNEVTITNIQVEKSSSATSYIPHAHNTTLIEMPTRLETVKVVRPVMEEGALEITNGAECTSTTEWRSNFIPVQPKEFIKVRNGSTERLAHIDFYDINKNFISYSGVVNVAYVPDNCYFIRFFMSKSNCSDLTITRQAWKPIQLNSLPNGVYDEIIMKPNSNKAQLVQRVGKVVLDGIYYPLIASASEVKGVDISCTYSVLNNVAGGICQSDKLLNVSYGQDYKNIECIMLGTNTIITSVLKTRAYNAGEYAKENPITVYYELATPIIHEIQLKGYPYVYEDGTVTLNTDVAHQTLVSYNVNQEQLIYNQNETIIRHDQQIDDLYYYIELYLEEIYQMELFRMKLELSL